MTKHNRLIGLISLFIISSVYLSGCSTSRYKHSQDFVPNPILDPTTLQNAVVKSEPLSAMGNPKRYTVWGREYQVVNKPVGSKQEGLASWYGMKFHGHTTSNGEIYDVYQMTAAHKSLPLPSYVKVTRKDNNQFVIVRVNDRGPFHKGRIIDLSYAAAVKLGIHKLGTAPVMMEVLSTPHTGPNKWLQVSAFSNQESATNLQAKLRPLMAWPVSIVSNAEQTLHKVRIGPIPEGLEVEKVKNVLIEQLLPEPLVLGEHQL
jgi:rare lipoprotein A